MLGFAERTCHSQNNFTLPCYSLPSLPVFSNHETHVCVSHWALFHTSVRAAPSGCSCQALSHQLLVCRSRLSSVKPPWTSLFPSACLSVSMRHTNFFKGGGTEGEGETES